MYINKNLYSCSRKGHDINFHDGPIISNMNDMFKKVSRLDFFNNFGISLPAMHLRGSWLEHLMNSWPSSTKNLDDFL